MPNYVEPLDMLAELGDDNKTIGPRLREAHNVCDEHRDIATASLIEVWMEETERRTWFLFEATRHKELIPVRVRRFINGSLPKRRLSRMVCVTGRHNESTTRKLHHAIRNCWKRKRSEHRHLL